jgi:hypothetical protein
MSERYIFQNRPAHPTVLALDTLAQRASDALPDCCEGGDRVYLVTGAGMVKIGRSSKVAGRVAAIQMMSPVALGLLAVSRGSYDFEVLLHRMCSVHRAHGEWFDLAGVRRVLESAFADARRFDECLRCAVSASAERRALRASIKSQDMRYRPRLKPVKRRFDALPPKDDEGAA